MQFLHAGGATVCSLLILGGVKVVYAKDHRNLKFCLGCVLYPKKGIFLWKIDVISPSD